jgi:predicted 2-oxoglutarate/Fe(II)-dependent dioxygenase YbiX/peroxiredoxin
MATYKEVTAGDPAPDATLIGTGGASYTIDRMAGRYVLLAFLHGADSPAGRAMRATIDRCTELFDDDRLTCLAITSEPGDLTEGRIATRLPGLRAVLDPERVAARLYGASPVAEGDSRVDLRSADGRAVDPHRQMFALIDPDLRLRAVFPLVPDGSGTAAVEAALAALPPPGLHRGQPVQPPILILPRIFEPDLCTRLIETYETQGGTLSGFMREVEGRTVGMHDASHKVRRDVLVTDPALSARIRGRVVRRIVPEIAKAYMFTVTRMERYLVACYDAGEGGHFAAHRDNTTSGTAHRRFAVSINLNDAFDGGEVCFPEYGPQGYRPPEGGAVVFSCALMHRVAPVTKGRRMAFLPFLYDEAAARIRSANRHLLVT